MYTGFKHLHSTLAYVVLILLIIAITKYVIGLRSKKPFGPGDRKFGSIVVAASHLQLLVGLALYAFLSPLTKSAFQDFGSAMSDPSLRLIAVEHITVNILGVIAVTIGSSRAKRAQGDVLKYKNILLFFSIGLVLFLTRIPYKMWWGML
ncbi:MAG: hypothetical protein JJU02_10580 [Cryomorphaceae bacterium]|nr:hypothetical protein [Cryomorphaceae bacterium]